MYAAVKAIEYYLPENILSNEDLAIEFPEWDVDKIKDKTGISNRHIVSKNECASDLAYKAAEKLFASGTCKPDDIDFLLLCTQSPDYFLPTTACILQDRLGIQVTAGALDFNLGCSGYIYGLSLAKGLVESGQARNVLLLTSETYSKYLKADDKTVRTIFGDGAAATFITGAKNDEQYIYPVVFGTDGKGKDNLIVRGGAMREKSGNMDLYMNGSEVFVFTLNVVPKLVEEILLRSSKKKDEIDLFIFHQANKYMLDFLRKKIEIPEEKFYVYLEDVGNTVSSTIPIALKQAIIKKKVISGDSVMLIGFGVGYSYAGTIIKIL